MPPKDTVYVRQSMKNLFIATQDNKSYGPVIAVTKKEWWEHKLYNPLLPKQWKHWCADSKLYPSQPNNKKYGGSSNREHWFYLYGHGHHWRINDKGMLQMGDNYNEFDRWALCNIEELPMPKTRDEFRTAIQTLIAKKEEFYNHGHPAEY